MMKSIIKEKSGFTLVELIVGIAILFFVTFSTLLIMTSSVNSIIRQEKRLKALHLAQGEAARVAGENFSQVIPENWVIDSTATPQYQLSIFNANVAPAKIFISSDNGYWYDDGDPNTKDLGFNGTGQDKTDGILVVESNGTIYTKSSTPSSNQYKWTPSNLTLTFNSSNAGKEIAIYYRYYHLVYEGGTIPTSDREGIKAKTIKLITNIGDTNGNGTSGEKADILGEDLQSATSLSSSNYASLNNDTRELVFQEAIKGHPVRLYYLPEQDNIGDSSGPQGIPDGYNDPTTDSIVGVVGGSFWDVNSGIPTRNITPTKCITVTEFRKQEGEIKEVELETLIQR